MTRDYIEFQDRSVPLGYLITFRCYGTWLHGDERGSVDRRFYNVVGAPKIAPNAEKVIREERRLKHAAYLLGAKERTIVEQAIRDVCSHRGFTLVAVNVRTNHAHAVTRASGSPERLMTTFKAYSTRALRSAGLIDAEFQPWSRHGSTRYLWTEDHIVDAADYVINGQGDELPRFE